MCKGEKTGFLTTEAEPEEEWNWRRENHEDRKPETKLIVIHYPDVNVGERRTEIDRNYSNVGE